MKWLSFSFLCLQLFGVGSAGCSIGKVETGTASGSVSFSQLFADAIVSQDDSREKPPAAQTETLPAVTGVVKQKIHTQATCHPGEMDLARIAQKAPGVAGLLLSLEVAQQVCDGNGSWDIANTVLGSVRISLDELSFHGAGQPVAPVKSLRSAVRSLKVTIPGALAQKGSLKASLFLCVDADDDGSCADEAVSSLNDAIKRANDLTTANQFRTLGFAPAINAELLRYQPGVLAYQPVSLSFQGGEIQLGQAIQDKGAASPDEAALFASAKNVGTELESLSSESAADIIVAEQTADGTCVPQVRTNGCFARGTNIQMAGGKLLPVEQIRKGMEVLTAAGEPREVLRSVAGPEKKPVITIRTLDRKSVTVTQGHPVMTRRGLKPAAELVATDEIRTEPKGFVGLASLTFSACAGNVYNFELSGAEETDHLIAVEGLVLGELALQEKLSAKALTARK